VGDGPLRQALAEQAGELDVTQHLNFVGFQRNPFRWVSHADLFLLASRYEGLPNALMEAIVLECPVWVKKHPGGAGEILAITGLGDRATPCLDLEQRLFEKPGRECAAKAEKVFQARAVVEQYLQLIETGSCG
jgi:glycosyltransferase involved in cell wall biosynthesis